MREEQTPRLGCSCLLLKRAGAMVKFDTHVDLVVEGQELPSNWTTPVQLVRSSPKLEVPLDGKSICGRILHRGATIAQVMV